MKDRPLTALAKLSAKASPPCRSLLAGDSFLPKVIPIKTVVHRVQARSYMAGIFAVFLSFAVNLSAQPQNAPLISLDELQPGMKGEVWTVFKGHDPEPFAVQVTGILRNALGPGKSMILCELTDPRVQAMGAVAGMSGSPLYLD